MISVRLLPVGALIAATATGAAAAPAAALAPCARTFTPRPIVTAADGFESSLVDRDGRLLFTSRRRNALLVIDRRGRAPRVLASGIKDPGGIALDGQGRIIVGFGNSVANGQSPSLGRAGLYRVDPRTGGKQVLARGLSMANGVVRGTDGTIYASDDFAAVLDRVTPRGTVTRGWATPKNPNGLALDPNGRWLYANLSFAPTKIVRIDRRDPRAVTTYADPGPADANAFLDGLAIDSTRTLYAAAFGAGQVWRIGTARRPCVLAHGLAQTTSVAVGRGSRGFGRGNLVRDRLRRAGRGAARRCRRRGPVGPALPPRRDRVTHLTSRTVKAAASPRLSPAPPSRPRIRATYPRVSG